MRPRAASLVLNGSACGKEHVFGLHAKTFVFDRRTVYVGSLNLNLRSRFLNAESGLVIESPELAAQIAADIELNMAPANSWRVVADRAWPRAVAGGRGQRGGHADPGTPGLVVAPGERGDDRRVAAREIPVM